MTTAENIQELYEGGYIKQALEYALMSSIGYEFSGDDPANCKYLRFWFEDKSEWNPPH